MPQRVSNWNLTDRGSATAHNDTYRGRGNATYQATSMRSNQGFASVKTTFPQGSFATCVYPDVAELQRKPEENTWHPRFVTPWDGENPDTPNHNTTGTKPLPVPFNQRPGWEEEEAREHAASRARFEEFQRTRAASSRADEEVDPEAHFYTLYSQTHIDSMIKSGQRYRPSKERVGTTSAERAMAAKKLETVQAQLAEQAEREAREEEEQGYMQSTQQRSMPAAASSSSSSSPFTGGYEMSRMVETTSPSGARVQYNVPLRQ